MAIPPDWTGGTLTVAPANLPIWPGYSTAVTAINGSVPGPTIRVRRGQQFEARVLNQLAEPLVLHWHGVMAPERMDGHPRDQVAAGRGYDVRFPVRQAASTCWYHAHTDQLTAKQAYTGVAGLFIIQDDAEAGLGLPSGDHDLPLVLMDKRSNPQRQLLYEPDMMDTMFGFLGDVALVNGTPDAWLSVDKRAYRFRLLNGSNARIFKIAFSDGRSFSLIGTDGGLLAAPVTVTSLTIAPGQRFEVVVDFSRDPLGGSVLMKSVAFSGGASAVGSLQQGTEMSLLRLYIDSPSTQKDALPVVLRSVPTLTEAQARRTRVFTLAMTGMTHTINGNLYDPQRIDFSVPFGEVEIWEYRNTGTEPHPMHAHAVQSQVLSRNGATPSSPEDFGVKDTILVNGGETVRVLIRFTSHSGMFVHHCHNLEHEDSGMMQNFEVLPQPSVSIRREGVNVQVSWPESARDWVLTSSTEPDGAVWSQVQASPTLVDGYWTTKVLEVSGKRFYRLAMP